MPPAGIVVAGFLITQASLIGLGVSLASPLIAPLRRVVFGEPR
jgi:hypothetical protein